MANACNYDVIKQQRAELLALVVECDKWLDGRLTAIKGGDHLHAQMKSIIANTQELKP